MIFYLYGLCGDAISKLFESALNIGSAWAVGVFYGRNWFLCHLAFYYEVNISSKDQLLKLIWGIVTIILLDGSSVHTVTNILSDRKQYDEI